MRILELYQGVYEPCCLFRDHTALVTEEIKADTVKRTQEGKASIPVVDDNIGSSHKSVNLIENSTALVKNDFLSDIATYCCVVTSKGSQVESALESALESSTMKKAIIIYNNTSVGRRRSRADSVRSVFTNPTQLRACNNMHVECVGRSGLFDDPLPIRVRRTDMWKENLNTSISENVIVAIEATHVCPLDVCIRCGLFSDYLQTPFVVGSNFVGIVHDGALPAGTRVAALTKTGGNARYVSISREALVKVPRRLDSSEVACIISTFLPGFQALHHGLGQESKYSNKALKGMKVLLTEGASIVELQAMVQLALLAEAASVHIICEPRYHNYVQIYLNATPLSVYLEDWLPVVRGQMDVIIDYDYSHNRAEIPDALAPGGRLVWFAHPPARHTGIFGDFDSLMDIGSICLLDRASIYDAYENWESASEDLKFLFDLLSCRKIRPKIDRFINLNGIRKAHDDLMKGGIYGAIICEPWKEENL